MEDRVAELEVRTRRRASAQSYGNFESNCDRIFVLMSTGYDAIQLEVSGIKTNSDIIPTRRLLNINSFRERACSSRAS